MKSTRPIRRALLSVSDKTGIIEFAQALAERNIEILSTGGTSLTLSDAGVDITEISEHTGFPEIMAGRVKTLHPKIHGGILARRGEDEAIMNKHDIQPIDLVVVNLYPFEQTINKSECTLANAIENIDIGGPTMLRAAAKNYTDVTVIVDHGDFANVIEEMDKNECSLTPETRFHLAVKAFEHTAKYDAMIANYLGTLVPIHSDNKAEPSGFFPRTLNLQYIKKQDMRYGENSHQAAAFYIEANAKEVTVATSRQLQGKSLSFNNIADTDTALECVKEFKQPACVIVKHANPCGVAIGGNIQEAYERAYRTDPLSAFGGIIAFNRALNYATAELILKHQFVEVIIAPKVDKAALTLLSTKQNIRVLVSGKWFKTSSGLDFKRVNGGLLVQERDLSVVATKELRVVTARQPSEKELHDALFCWRVAKYVKSNAIVYAKDQRTIGVGAGQMSRVYSAVIAGIKARDAKLKVAGAVMASDAFLPFRDGIDEAAAAGITCVIQPGGSIRDEEVINAANEHNIAMIFTGMRHFRH